jgi:hypothetical protein
LKSAPESGQVPEAIKTTAVRRVDGVKFALLLSLADLAVERGYETTEELPLATRDLAEKFIGFYWRQVLPWARVPVRPRTPPSTGDRLGRRGRAVHQWQDRHIGHPLRSRRGWRGRPPA